MAMAPQATPSPAASPPMGGGIWERPNSGFGGYARHVIAVILAALLTAVALALALKAAVRYLVRRRGRTGSGSEERDSRDRDSNANISDPENSKPVVEAPQLPPPPALAMVYSAASTNKLAGAAAECTICLTEFADGDAIRVMPACRHGFHASCIERWLAGGRRSTCPTCRAKAAAQPGGATNRREPYSGTGDDNATHVAFIILAGLHITALALALLQAVVRYFLVGNFQPL